MEFFKTTVLLLIYTFLIFDLGIKWGRYYPKKLRHQAEAPKVGKHKESGKLCPDCNGEGGFAFSQDPDDCCICPKCNGSGHN